MPLKGDPAVKKLFLFILISTLVFAAFPALAQGQVYEVDNAADFDYYMENAEDGSTIRLTKDISAMGSANVTSSLILDLNGHTLRDGRSGSMKGQIIWVQSSGQLVITGNGVIEKDLPAPNLLYADGRMDIMNGVIRFKPYTLGENGISKDPTHLGSLIVSRVNAAQGYQGYVNVYGGTLDGGYRNPRDVAEYEPQHPQHLIYPILNEHNSHTGGITVYGGTIVDAHPNLGEGNPEDGVVNGTRTWYLKGQTGPDQIPDGYVISSEEKAGHTLYTTDFLFTITARKKVISLTDEDMSPAGFTLRLVDSATGETVDSAITGADGTAVFTLKTSDMGKVFTLEEEKGVLPGMLYDDTAYQVAVVPGGEATSFAPTAQISLNGQTVNEALFVNTWSGAVTPPPTGDASAPAVYLFLLLGCAAALTLLRRKSSAR